MKGPHFYLAALGLAGASLSSCSRSTYSFNPATPAYLNSVPTAATAPAPVVRPVAPVVAAMPTQAAEPTPAKPVSARPAYAAATYTAVAPAVVSVPVATAPKPNLAQRLVLNKLNKKLAKVQSRTQNTASTTETAARKGSFTVAIIGLIALLIGIIANSALVIVIGAIVLVVGLILALLNAF